jgi:hypothetical protein
MAQPETPSPDLTQKELDQISIMAGMGMTLEKIALVLGISERTLYRRKRINPLAQAAFEKGKSLAEYQVSKSLFEMAVNEKNLGAIIWYEKTRCGRSEKQEISHQIEGNAQQVLIYLPDNERDTNTNTENTGE